MKVNKKKLMATIGALGLTAGVLAGCSSDDTPDDDDMVKVVDSDGNVKYIDEDELDNNGGGMGFFMLYSNWNGSNHSNLKSSSGYKGKTYTSKPSTSSKSGSGVGKSSSSKGSGFGG